jgi:CRP-like cAMP-binding protein
MQNTYSDLESCLESKFSPFNGLNQKEKEVIIQHHITAQVRKGGSLFLEGEKSKGLIYLLSGKAKVFRVGVGGREHILKLLRPGDLFGFQVLFTDMTWPATSQAIEDSQICIFEKQPVLSILKSNPVLSIRFSRILTEELSYTYNKMVSLTQKHVRGRLVESLLMLGEIYGYEDDRMTLKAALSRNDIAHLSNMTTSNAIRTLSNLASEGNIRIKGRKITLLNMQNLLRISEQA